LSAAFVNESKSFFAAFAFIDRCAGEANRVALGTSDLKLKVPRFTAGTRLIAAITVFLTREFTDRA